MQISSALLVLLCCVTLSPHLFAQRHGNRPLPKVGGVAPEFTLKDQNGEEVSLRDFRGKKNVVLAFYVFAFSASCGTQLQNLQRNLGRFQAGDTQVLGVSMDSMFANYAFAQELGISFPLLSDWGGAVTRRYGVYNEIYKGPRRMALLINKSGRIVDIWLDKKAIASSALVNACEREKAKE